MSYLRSLQGTSVRGEPNERIDASSSANNRGTVPARTVLLFCKARVHRIRLYKPNCCINHPLLNYSIYHEQRSCPIYACYVIRAADGGIGASRSPHPTKRGSINFAQISRANPSVLASPIQLPCRGAYGGVDFVQAVAESVVGVGDSTTR